jgi:hypothetical protein
MKIIRMGKIAADCLLVIIFLSIIRCGTVASVQPIGKGESTLAFSLAGPVAPVFDIKMPIPYTVLRYRRGLNENTDFHFGVHPTMMTLGNLSLDVGITKHIVPQSGSRPALSLEGSIYGFYHLNEISSIRIYPEITLIGSYRFSERGHILYFGVHNMMQLAQPYLVFVPLIGFEVPISNKFVINLETKWYAQIEESEDRVVDYSLTTFGYGAIGFACGLSYKL